MTPINQCLSYETFTRQDTCETPTPRPVCTEPHPELIEDPVRGMSYVACVQTCVEELHRIRPSNQVRSALQRLQQRQGQVPTTPQRSQPQPPAPTTPPAQTPDQPARPQGPGLTTLSDNVGAQSFWHQLRDDYVNFANFSWWEGATTGQRAIGLTLYTAAVLPIGAAASMTGGLGVLGTMALAPSRFGR